MAETWPQHYTVRQAERFLQTGLPILQNHISGLENKIRLLEEKIEFLESTKADRKGRKPNAGVQIAGEELE